jgi:hypothetical protein
VENSTHLSEGGINDLIRDFISMSPEKTMQDKNDSPAWDQALFNRRSCRHRSHAGTQLDHRQIRTVFICLLLVGAMLPMRLAWERSGCVTV